MNAARWETPRLGEWAGLPGRLALRSVQACERGEGGTILVWRRGEEGAGQLIAVPMLCGSWRCRRCSWRVGRQDFRRIEQAVRSRPRWLYCVLTFAQRSLPSPWDAYRVGGDLWAKRLKRRLERRFGALEYVQTWEAHASGWPHLNLMVTSPALIEHLDELSDERRWSETAGHGKGRWCTWTPFRKELRGMVAASGLQRADWVERIDGGEGLAWYLAKIAHELSSAALKAADQTPIMAPAHFRRFRGSKGLIPKPVKYSWIRHVDEATGQITFDIRARNPERESEWTGIVSPAPPGTFDERLPTWTGDWEEAMTFRDKVRDKAKAKAAAKAAGTWIETAHLETGRERR